VGKVSPHWMRHAHAGHALARGAPIHLVQTALGHSLVATTGRYLHASPTERYGYGGAPADHLLALLVELTGSCEGGNVFSCRRVALDADLCGVRHEQQGGFKPRGLCRVPLRATREIADGGV
jgi:integrase-like protein